jgi:hypothetical protein
VTCSGPTRANDVPVPSSRHRSPSHGQGRARPEANTKRSPLLRSPRARTSGFGERPPVPLPRHRGVVLPLAQLGRLPGHDNAFDVADAPDSKYGPRKDWQYQTEAATTYVELGNIVTALKPRTLSITATCFQYHVYGRGPGLKIRSSQEGVGSSPTFGTLDLRPIATCRTACPGNKLVTALR